MSDQPPPWGAFGQQDPRQYQGQPQYPPQQPYGHQPYPPRSYQAPRHMPPGRRGRKSWAARHKVLTAIGSVIGLFVALGVIGAVTSDGSQPTPAGPAAAASTAAPAVTQLATTKPAAKPKASRAARTHARDAEAACYARPMASGDIYVRMITPGESPVAQELGGEWVWNSVSHKCLTSVQMMIATAPQVPGNCTQVGYAADNPGYDPDATPAGPLKEVADETGPAC